FLPGPLVQPQGQLLLHPHHGQAQQQRLVGEDLEPPLIPIACRAKAELGKSLRLTIKQGCHAELLRKTPQLPERSSPLVEVDEVGPDPALRKKAQRLPRLCAFFRAEYLNFHLRFPASTGFWRLSLSSAAAA